LSVTTQSRGGELSVIVVATLELRQGDG